MPWLIPHVIDFESPPGAPDDYSYSTLQRRFQTLIADCFGEEAA